VTAYASHPTSHKMCAHVEINVSEPRALATGSSDQFVCKCSPYPVATAPGSDTFQRSSCWSRKIICTDANILCTDVMILCADAKIGCTDAKIGCADAKIACTDAKTVYTDAEIVCTDAKILSKTTKRRAIRPNVQSPNSTT
jgi:hypothetical protein